MIFSAANGMQYEFCFVLKTGGIFSFSLLRRGDPLWAGSPSPNTWMGGWRRACCYVFVGDAFAVFHEVSTALLGSLML